MLAALLAGWAAASAWGPHATGRLWGLVPWPDLPTPDSHALSDKIGDVQVALIIAMAALLVAGALKHPFSSKDSVMARMLPSLRRRPV